MFAQLLTLREYAMGEYTKEESHETRKFPPFSEALFARMLSLERKRSERSRRPFVLMLVDVAKLFQANHHAAIFARLSTAFSSSTRETDICGWHKKGSVIGVIFTEIGSADTNTLCTTMLSKINTSLSVTLDEGQIEKIHISFHVFPEDSAFRNGGSPDVRSNLYPDLHRIDNGKKAARLIKRAIDIVGSLAALIVLSPWFLGIAIAIKLTSKGPILFKQTRIGQFGVPFTFLKFRSMYFLNDDKIHQEYLRRFIAGKEECNQADGSGGVYKLKNDPRITPIGMFLRKSSLDEFPQFFNVLRGEMSLVGPRPPIPYETEAYDIWHRRRFFEVKPGITGLWQVSGRSRLKFDEMVRLDIKYAREWSLGLDLKILLKTPRVVLFGDGAY